MNFSIIEVKDKDLFVIYDMENKGACCCTKYTITELLKMGHNICGAKIVNGRLKIVECDLNGNIRNKKAPNCCDDLTKRSPSTINKGLSEKQYPRVKQNRSGLKGEYAPGTIFFWNTVNSEGKKISSYAVMLPNGCVVRSNGNVIPSSEVNKDIANFEPLTTVNPEIRAGLMEIYNNTLKRMEIDADIQGLKDEINKLEMKKSTLISEKDYVVKKLRSSIDDNIFQNKVSKFKESVTGKEIEDMSFYNGTLDRARAVAIIEKSSRKCVYTYGLSYRNPTTHNAPRTKKEAIAIVRNGGFVDVHFRKDVISINEYSENDMW